MEVLERSAQGGHTKEKLRTAERTSQRPQPLGPRSRREVQAQQRGSSVGNAVVSVPAPRRSVAPACPNLHMMTGEARRSARARGRCRISRGRCAHSDHTADEIAAASGVAFDAFAPIACQYHRRRAGAGRRSACTPCSRHVVLVDVYSRRTRARSAGSLLGGCAACGMRLSSSSAGFQCQCQGRLRSNPAEPALPGNAIPHGATCWRRAPSTPVAE